MQIWDTDDKSLWAKKKAENLSYQRNDQSSYTNTVMYQKEYVFFNSKQIYSHKKGEYDIAVIRREKMTQD